MLKTQSVWQHHRAPREILLEQGAAALTDYELLAIFLRTGVAGIDVLTLSKQLLAEFGSLYQLISADFATFTEKKGLGSCKFAQLHAAIELSRRFFTTKLARENCLSSPDTAREYLQNLLSDRDREIFVVMFLDNQHHVLQHQELFMGTINCVEVHPRVIVREALKINAAAIILAHNHPSGIATPSDGDLLVTEQIIRACALLDIHVLDHLVIGRGEYLSFAESGLMATMT